jgi:aspartate racemase
MSTRRHLGILAHSVEGASLCLREFCHRGFTDLGPHDHPDVTLDCIALARSMSAWDAGDHVSIRATLAESVRRLAGSGADFFVCPDNTAHLALELPGAPLPLPGLHIAEAVAHEAQRRGHRAVGVLGTRYLMDGSVYRTAMVRRGIAVEVPQLDDRLLVNGVIFDELVNGVLSGSSRTEFIRIIAAMAERGCDAVALVCTEIPLLITPDVSPLPTLDSTRLLAHAAFDVALGRRPAPAWRGGPVPG